MKYKIQKESKRSIHVCPNGCNANLSTVAHVRQDWVVDLTGSFVRRLDDPEEPVACPDDDNIWTCMECGAEADLFKAVPFHIHEEGACSKGTLYIPLTLCTGVMTEVKAWAERPVVFWVGAGDTTTKTIFPCEGTENIFEIPDVGQVKVVNPCTWENGCQVIFVDEEGEK